MKGLSKTQKQRGQSLIEFALLVPILAGMVLLLIQIVTAINIAIVSQKYTRNHLYHLFFNHRYYLEMGFMVNERNLRFHTRTWMGMHDKFIPDTPDGKVDPIPPKVKIGSIKVNDLEIVEDDPDLKRRQNVRIKVTSFTCGAPFGFTFDRPFTEGNLEEDSFSNGGNRYRYCIKEN